MINKTELLKNAIKLYMEADQSDPESEVYAFAVKNLLHGGAHDTLAALVKNGPLWDGDVPCKSGRDLLLDLGLASKACVKGEQGYQVATYAGYDVLTAGVA